jgi:hypothetical protein
VFYFALVMVTAGENTITYNSTWGLRILHENLAHLARVLSWASSRTGTYLLTRLNPFAPSTERNWRRELCKRKCFNTVHVASTQCLIGKLSALTRLRSLHNGHNLCAGLLGFLDFSIVRYSRD